MERDVTTAFKLVEEAIGQLQQSGCPYGIGDYCLTENPIAPADRWPGTTWEALENRVLVGKGTGTFDVAVGTQGGSEALAAHAHKQKWTGSGPGGVNLPSNVNYMAGITTNSGGAGQGQDTASAGTGNSGNLQPYRVCYIWRRTA